MARDDKMPIVLHLSSKEIEACWCILFNQTQHGFSHPVLSVMAYTMFVMVSLAVCILVA